MRNLTVVTVFRASRSSQLTPFIHTLTDPEGGGAIDVPVLTQGDGEMYVTSRHGQLAEMGGISDFAQHWSDTQPDVKYVGIRRA